MRNAMLKFLNKFIRGGVLLPVFIFASCGEDSGLGGAIDTKAPVLSIDYPKESGSAIRDTFILAGSVSDDKSISKVTVSVKSLDDGGKISETYSADFDISQKRWWIDINRHDDSSSDYHNGWQYPDGNYEFSVTAFDNAGNNSGTYSKTLEIDNTPPLFIISNPGVIKKTGLSPSAYGSIFTIDGTISDNHTISFMDVKIFDASGNCVSSESYEGENLPFYREEEIATAGGTSVQIAQYGNSTGNSRYSQLHPSDTGTEYYYAEVTLTDSTKVYRDPWADSSRSATEISMDEKGNSTSSVYLYDDVYSTLMSVKKGLGLSAANLKDIISGVYDGDKDRAGVLSILNQKKYDTSAVTDSDPMANRLSFSLNPEANPTYNVNGFQYSFKSTDTIQTASTGNTVSVTISAGLDGTNIDPENVRVWMKAYSSRPAETEEDTVKADLNALEKAVEALERSETDFMDSIHATSDFPVTNVTTSGSDWILVYDYSMNNSKGSSVTTKTFSVTLPEGIELSKYYILGVTGYDIEDVEFSQRTVYGFEGNTAGVPPTINFEEPASLSVWKDFEKSESKFSGTAAISSNSLYISEFTAELQITDESSNKLIGTFTDTITCKIEDNQKIWTYSDSQALTWDAVSSTWHFDPVKIKALKELYDESESSGVYWLATLKVSGKSSSGHEGEATRSIKIDTVEPKISISSVTPSVSGADYFGGTDTNTYLNGIVTIRGSIEEQNLPDEENAVTYDVLASLGNNEPVSILDKLIEHKEELNLPFDGKLGKIFSINIPFDTRIISNYYHLVEGGAEDEKINIEMIVTATDKAGNSSTYSSKTLNGGKNFVIHQETDRPQIKLGNADETVLSASDVKVNKNLFGTKSNNRLQINFNDDDNVAEYELTLCDESGNPMANGVAQSDGSTANPYRFTPGKTTATLNYTLPPVEAKYQILVEARDYLSASSGITANPYGEKVLGKFFVAVDSGAPDIEINSPAAGSYEKAEVTLSATISKEVEPQAELSKLNEATSKYEKIASFTTVEQDGAKVKKESEGVYKWIGKASVSSDGTYKISVSAKDAYDQESSKDRIFYVDTQAPLVGNPATSDETLVKLDTTSYVNVTSVITDSPSGVSAAKYFLSKEPVTKDSEQWSASYKEGSGWTQMNKGAANYNASIDVKTFADSSDIEDGKVYVYVAAEDNAGNIAVNQAPLELTLDRQAPAILIKGFGGEDVPAEAASQTADSAKTISVIVTDTNVSSLVSDNSAVTVGTGTKTGNDTTYPVSVSWTGESGKIEDEKTVKFTAKDSNGREASQTLTLRCDNNSPRVTLNTNYQKYQTKSLELKGTVTDKNFTTGSENFKIYLISESEKAEGRVSFTPAPAASAYDYDWSASFSELEEHEYNIAIYAKDSFGNDCGYRTNSSVSVPHFTGTANELTAEPITVDTTPPSSTFTVKLAGTSGISGKVVDSAKNEISPNASGLYELEANKIYYINDKFELGGTITEENLDVTEANKPSLTVKKNNAAPSPVTSPTASGQWAYDSTLNTDGTDDSTYEYSLALKDLARQSFEAKVTLILDTKAPVFAFTSPSEGESFESTPAAKISYSDDGAGVDAENGVRVEVYNITDSPTPSASNKLSSSDYTFTPGSATGSLLFNSGFDSEGSFKIVAKVKDYLGHETSEEIRTFYYDKSKPEVDESSVTSSGLTTNGGTAKKFILSGTVSDSNALYENGGADSEGKTAITISASVTRIGVSKEENWKIPLTVTEEKKAANWSKEFLVGAENSSAENYLPDGTYNFAIIATDVAGKTTQISRTVKVDTVAPNLENPAVTTASTTDGNGNKWYKTESLRFAGTSSDENGTGIKEVTYKTSENDTDWTAASPLSGTTSWSGTVSGIKSNQTKVKILVEDNAGNITESDALGPWNIDVTEPTLNSGSVRVNGAEVSESSPFYSNGAKDGASAVNPAVTFSVADELNGSGIAKVDVHLYSKATDTTAADVIHITDVVADGSCSATIPATSITKSGTAYARIYDNAGNATDVNLFALTYDTTDPKIISPVLEEKTANFKTYKTKDANGKEFYYVNNGAVTDVTPTTYHKFTLSGVATDNLGLSKITLSITDGTKTLDTVEIVDKPATTDKDELADWVFDNIDLHELSGDNTKATLTLYDKAGNKAESIISIKYDTAVPAALHELDGSGKDYTFRIGDGTGGKYSPGTYGNNTTIMIRGYFTEALSGLSMLYYKVLQTPPTQAEADSFLADYKTGSTGFAALSTVKTANVYSSADNETKTVESNFETTISSFEEGNNYLLLVAVDNVGNAALDTAIIGSGSNAVTGCYSINVDVKAPEIEASNMDAHLTNGKSDIVITGTAKDNPSGGASGIKSIVASLKVGETEYKSSDENPKIKVEPNPDVTGAVITTTDASLANWKVTIDKSVFSADTLTSGNFTVYATVTDNAGEVKSNSQTSNIGTITVDKKLKKVVLNAPADADKTTSVREINGIIDLTGTVEDDNPLSNTAIDGIQYIKKADYTAANDNTDTGWTTLTNKENENGEMSDLSLTGNYTFSIKNFDTTKIEPKNDVAYFIRAKAQDKAGNIGYSAPVAVTISQDSDRPVIKLTNLTDLGAGSNPRFVLKYGTKSQVIATVDDDDGIDEVYFSESSFTGAAGQTAPNSDMSAYSAANGTVTFTPQADITAGKNVDGSKGFYIYVKDTAGKVFYTSYDTQSGANYLNVPKVKIGDYHENSADAAKFSYQSDSTSPTVVDIRGLAFKAGASSSAAGVVNGGLDTSETADATNPYTEYEAVNASYVLGGTERQWAQFQVEASDASGIAGMAMEIKYTKKDGTEVTKTFSSHNDFKIDANTTVTAAANFVASGNNATWTTDKVSFADAETDSVAVKVVPYDKLGLVGNGNVTLMVDNTAPTIKISSPASGEEKTGDVSFTGSAIDNGNAGTAEVFWIIPKQSDIPESTVAETTKLETLKNLKLADGTSLWNGGSSAMPVKASVTSWQFDFDGKYNDKNATVNPSDPDNYIFKAGNPKLDVYDSETFASTVQNGVYTLPIYLMAIDKLGNYDIKTDYVILHNPDGDRPKVAFTYPTASSYDKNSDDTSKGYITLGGTIRATGSAEIPSGTTTVKNVYLQIGNDSGTFAANKTAAQAAMTAYGFTIVDAYTVINDVLGLEGDSKYSSTNKPAEAKLKELGFASQSEMDNWWGIKTNGSASWNIALNSDGKMNPADNNTTKDITIRACGINAEGKMGAWTQQDNVIAIHIDNAAPSLSATIEQFASDITSETTAATLKTLTPSVSQNYESDMFLRGQWYLVVTALDASGIGSLTVSGTGTTKYEVPINPDDADTGITDSTTSKKGRKVFIPIDKTGTSATYTVKAEDMDGSDGNGVNHPVEQTFTFKIDNTAPSLESITANGAVFSDENIVQNSNYKFTLEGKSTDEGSGLERVLFYYMRKSGETKDSITNEVILDPMVKPTGDNYDAVKVAMSKSGIEVLTLSQPSETAGGTASTYDLYARKVSGTATTTTLTGTFDSHVRVGGLITFDKAIFRRITAVTSTQVTFEPALTSAPAGQVEAWLPIAQVIDNSATELTESDSANPFTFAKSNGVPKDDGDLMPESFSKTGKTWTWDASIHSDNLPDGPVSLVIIAFDVAGNINGRIINTSVSNNAPRVAKVYFGTDLSGDGKFVNSDSLQEIVEYNILAAEGKEQSAYELDFTAKDEKNRAKYANGIFTIKNGLAVIPELTGGNGNIAMVLNAAATNTDKTTGTTAAGTLLASSVAGVTTTTTDEDTGAVDVSVSFSGDKINGTFTGSDPSYRMQAFVLAKDKLGSDAASKGISFTFWDSTEETVQGTSSQSSVLYVKNFKVAQTDSTVPTVVVNPFYWNSITDNSVYNSANASKFTDLKGHIELEKDLVITKTDGTTVDTTLKTQLGADPKVSGKITVSGTAYDNTRLASLTVKFGSYKTAVAATYNATTSSWNVPATTLANDGYIFTVSDVQKDSKGNTKYYGNWEEDVYFGQKGHKVYWTLSLDTEKLLGTTAVAKDVVLSVTATDAAGKTTAGTVTAATTDEEGKRLVTDGTTNVPTYQMDVVPYVVKVTTALSKKKKSNPSVANRTALGHYPVQTVVTNMDSAMNNTTSETVTLEGFNLKHTSVAVTGGTSVSSTASSASEMSKIMFNVASLASGTMTATVNSIPVINNLNNNDASGDAESAGTNNVNWYNRIGNGDNNNTLTDDVIFDVWEFNDKAAVPFSGTVGGTKMKINQVSGQPNFAFTNGNLWWNMGGNVNVNGKDFSSYYWSGGYDCLATVTVGFHVDEMGYTYGSGAGGDSNTSTPPAIDSYTMWVQRWGLGSQDARSTYGTSGGQVTNGAALEKVGQTEVVNGVTKYAMNKQRIQSPEFASAKNGNNTNLYHAYYDAMNDEIRFKAGTITGTKNGSTGQFVDQYCSQYGESSKTYNIDNVQVVASKSIPGRGPGKYLGIAVAKDGTTDVVVMVWYDAYENQLLYSYKVNPIANLNSKDATAANWSAPKTIFDEGGEWCQIAVDAKNHIHIAAFAGDGDLKYAYLESYSTAKADIKTCTVDADGTVGEHLTLDVALDADGNSIPYIGYYSSTHKKPKYAYVVDTSAPAPAGVDEADMFTGAWEVTVVPCYSNMVVNQEEKINVGVWKYTADDGTNKKGQIKNSKTGTSSYYSVTGNSLYNGTNWSKTYGNGTANGILAYQVQDGSGSCVETAQMR